jgi:hypothetical protein
MAGFGYVMMEDEEVTVVMVKSGGDGVLTPFPETITRDRRQSWKGEARTPWQRQAADSGGTAGDVAGDVGVVGVSRISGVGDAVLGVGCGVGAMEMEKRETGGPAMNGGERIFGGWQSPGTGRGLPGCIAALGVWPHLRRCVGVPRSLFPRKCPLCWSSSRLQEIHNQAGATPGTFPARGHPGSVSVFVFAIHLDHFVIVKT